MRRFIVSLTIAIALSATGCQRKSESPGSVPAGVTPAAADPSSGLPEAATLPMVHWDCGGGMTITTKYLPRDQAISLGLHEGERKLPRVSAASGEKYQDGPITFWAKGDTAMYERAPAPSVECRRTSGA